MGCLLPKVFRREACDFAVEQETELCSLTGFSRNQVRRLFLRFRWLDRGETGWLTTEDLLRLPELRANPLGERIVSAMSKEGAGDQRSRNEFPPEAEQVGSLKDVKIGFRAFLCCFARFRALKEECEDVSIPYASLQSKMALLFRLFDLSGSGEIGMAEVFALLLTMSPTADEELLYQRGRKIMTEATPKDADSPSVSFEYFCKNPHIRRLSRDLYLSFSE